MPEPVGRVTGAQTKFYVNTSAPAATKPTSTEAAAVVTDADNTLFAKTIDWTAPQQTVDQEEQQFYGQEEGESYAGTPTYQPMTIQVQIDHSNAIHQRMIGLHASSYSIGATLYFYAATTKGADTVYRYYRTQWSGFSENIPLTSGASVEATFAIQKREILVN